MRRVVSSLLILGAAISGLTWACVTSPSFTSSKLIGPSPIAVGSQGIYKLTAIRTTGNGEDDTARATWDVTPSTVARVDRPGVITGLSEGLATVTATLENTVATMPLRVLVPGNYHVSGTVRDQSGNPVPGATVIVIGGQPSTTNATGDYTLSSVYGLTTIRASLANFTSDRQINVNANTTGVDFTLPIPPGFVNLGGTWATTLVAPSACASQLPAAAQQRSYTVAIKQLSGGVNFVFSSPSLTSSRSFDGTLGVNGLSLPLRNFYYYYYYYFGDVFDATLTDRLAPGQWLNVKGTINAPSPTTSPFIGTFSGEFDFYTGDPGLVQPPAGSVPKIHCFGSSSVTFTRTSATTALRSRR